LPACPSPGNWGGKSTPKRRYPRLYDAILDAGAKPFGMWALNSLRIEKGYRAWKGDLSTDYSLLEGGLDRFIRFDKPQDFPGKAALLAEKQRGVKKRFVTLTVDAGDGGCALHVDALARRRRWSAKPPRAPGATASASPSRWGCCAPIWPCPGTELEVDIFGDRRPAIVQPDGPLWDPGNDRLRA
jgi:dimethylglycine dehydrogenase